MKSRIQTTLSLLASIAPTSCLIAPRNQHSSQHSPLHTTPTTTKLFSSSNKPDSSQNTITNLLLKFRTASAEGFGTKARNVASTCQVGDIVVPLCGDLEKRRLLAGRGVYPGVEYLICGLSDGDEKQNDQDVEDVASNDEEMQSNTVLAKQRIATIRPAYPLRQHLERSDWPITVSLSDVPLWLSKTTYEAGTALGTLMLSGTYLAMAAIAASVLRLAFIPSESMIPALMPGDVVLVTRSIFPPKVGDVVFFDPPSSLDEAIANSKIGRAAAAASDGADVTPTIVSTKGKQFIKRVVAVPGESVGVYNSNPYVALCQKNSDKCTYRVDRTGQYSRPDIFPDESWNRVTPTINSNYEPSSVLDRNEFFVAGDNGYRSVDSRVWGPLRRQNIFGTAQFVVFPPSHVGRIPSGNISVEDVLQ